jgi:hypothetical protein
MTYTPEQISQIVLKVLKEIEEPNIMDLSMSEKCDLAKRTSSSDVLRTLSTDDNYVVRSWVILNSNTPEDVLRSLATDKSPNVRRGVAQTLNTPEDALRTLSTDKDSSIRRGVALNPYTPEDALRTLATDEDFYVRQGVAQNPNYKPGPYKTLELTKVQYDALKQLIDSCKNSDLLNINL